MHGAITVDVPCLPHPDPHRPECPLCRRARGLGRGPHRCGPLPRGPRPLPHHLEDEDQLPLVRLLPHIPRHPHPCHRLHPGEVPRFCPLGHHRPHRFGIHGCP